MHLLPGPGGGLAYMSVKKYLPPAVKAAALKYGRKYPTFERYNIVSMTDKQDALTRLESFRATGSAASNVVKMKPKN